MDNNIPLAEIETVFMPILMEETEKSLDKRLLARTLLDGRIVCGELLFVVQ